RYAHEQMIADEQWGVRRPVALFRVGNLHVPANLAVPGVERHQMRVRRGEIDEIAIHRCAAMADVESLVLGIRVLPYLPSRSRVDRPDAIRRRDVHHAVHDYRAGFDLIAASGLERPREPELLHVVGRYLR